jgi:hypothetical protein
MTNDLFKYDFTLKISLWLKSLPVGAPVERAEKYSCVVRIPRMHAYFAALSNIINNKIEQVSGQKMPHQ